MLYPSWYHPPSDMIRVLVLGAIRGTERSALQFAQRFLNTIITEFGAEIPWAAEYTVGRDSSVGITTRYGLEFWGIESRYRATYYAHVQKGHGANQPTVHWVPCLSTGYRVQSVSLTTHFHLAPRLKKEYSYISTFVWDFVVYSRVKITFLLHSVILLPHLNHRLKFLFAPRSQV